MAIQLDNLANELHWPIYLSTLNYMQSVQACSAPAFMWVLRMQT